MTRHFTRILVSALALVIAIATAADFHVAPGGIDSNTGSKGQPLATLQAARDAARAAGAGPHRIVVGAGDYFLEETLQLDARDNGLTVEAAQPGKATLYGGKLVKGWRRDPQRHRAPRTTRAFTSIATRFTTRHTAASSAAAAGI